MTHRFSLAIASAAAALMLGGCATSPARLSDSIELALSDGQRSADNIALDAGRKPAELLKILDVRPGMTVADMFGGNRYWSELLSPVVGAKGTVILWHPEQFSSAKTKASLKDLHDARPNVKFAFSPMETPLLPAATFDRMLLNLDYHDVYWTSAKYGIVRMDPDAWLKPIYAAMKPGGEVLVVDHRGPAGDTRAIVEKSHRIAEETVVADFERAGFVTVGRYDLYRNPSDDLKTNVFDAAIRGKTDRFVVKFRKPR